MILGTETQLQQIRRRALTKDSVDLKRKMFHLGLVVLGTRTQLLVCITEGYVTVRKLTIISRFDSCHIHRGVVLTTGPSMDTLCRSIAYCCIGALPHRV